VKGSDKEKQTNEIKIAIPLLDSLDIQGKTITADALLTQRKLADYIVPEWKPQKNRKNKLIPTIPTSEENERGEHGGCRMIM